MSLADIADGSSLVMKPSAGLDDATFIAQLTRTALERDATATELADRAGCLHKAVSIAATYCWRWPVQPRWWPWSAQ